MIKRDSKGRFVKGNIPWLKGKHIQTNTGRTHFKKGKHYSPKTEIKKGQHLSKKTEFKKGHKESVEIRERRIKALKGIHSGVNHPNWQGGKSFEDYGDDYNKYFKDEIKERDNYICMICRIHQEKFDRILGVHHVNYNKKLSIPENCITLCPRCHGLTNYNKRYWLNFLQSLLSEKYNYQYSENKEIVLEVAELED